jgi:glycerophosphoryl diester phosphodiesterase
MHPDRLVAHRGHLAHHPENTRAALREALDLGARWIELDVQLSRDGVPVLFHDRTLERLCGVQGAIHDHDSGELAQLSVQGEKLMRLDELPALLEPFPRAQAFVEIKRVALEQHGLERVTLAVEHALETALPRCVWISFALDYLLYLRTRAPRALGAVIDRFEQRNDPRLRALAPEFLFCDLEGLPPTGELRQPGSRLVVYEVDRAETARELFARGVDLIETFQFAKLAGGLAS